jgi:predicted nucleic acid-binding protein
VKIINTTLKDFETTERLSSDYKKLSISDALHLAVAKRAGAHNFLTFDKMLSQASQKVFKTQLIR